MLKNRLYRFNLWLDRDEVTKLILLVSLLLLALISSYAGVIGLLFSILIISVISIFAIFRANIMNGNVKFDRTKYVLPEIGETLVIQKEFYFDGNGRRIQGHGAKPWHWNIRKGTEWKVTYIEEVNGDWYIFLTPFRENRSGDNISIKLIDDISYYKTKAQIRNLKLLKIGI